jgi:hypothetical protein
MSALQRLNLGELSDFGGSRMYRPVSAKGEEPKAGGHHRVPEEPDTGSTTARRVTG